VVAQFKATAAFGKLIGSPFLGAPILRQIFGASKTPKKGLQRKGAKAQRRKENRGNQGGDASFGISAGADSPKPGFPMPLGVRNSCFGVKSPAVLKKLGNGEG
jgi:hypothetical protein